MMEIVLLLSLFIAVEMGGGRTIRARARYIFAGKLMPATMWAHIDEAMGN
jgi:hypothetical protein